MSRSVADLLSELRLDPWRDKTGFSPEIEDTNKQLFDRTKSEADYCDALASWIRKHQPCIFGRIAAASGFLKYCILSESDLLRTDDHIAAKIQAARLAWMREGFEGKKNGLIILAVSERLARSTPDEVVRQLATRLCGLYLQRDVRCDEIVHDDLFLQKPGALNTTWKWKAGVNYFSAHGDRRWWQDHRVPGGLGFSINSIGHMVKSDILAKAMAALDSAVGAPAEDRPNSKVDSFARALDFAMRTIAQASEGPSGRTTELLALPTDLGVAEVAKCPIRLSNELRGKDWREYLGRYHTDFTLPSEFFRPDVLRPADLANHVLDFTYLSQRTINNPDFYTMSEGQPIRDTGETQCAFQPGGAPLDRFGKMLEQEVDIEHETQLAKAIGRA